METRAHRRDGDCVPIFSEQRRQGSVTAQGHGRLAGWRCRRFHSAASRAQSAVSLHAFCLAGVQKLSVTEDEFRAVLGRFPSGVTVVTTTDESGADQGMTVSAFCSLSLHPPLILICIEKTASAYKALTTSGGFVINVLSARQEQVARRFAIVDIDRFEGVGFTRSSQGYAVLDDVLGVIECTQQQLYDGGDHTVIIGKVEAMRAESGTPLLYYRGGYAQLEH